MGEGITERGNRLDRWVGELPDGVILVEAESALDLVHCGVLVDLDGVGVEVLDVSRVHEYENFLWVVAEGNYVLDIADGHLLHSFQVKLGSVQIFLVIGDLDDQGNIERLLQIVVDDEGNGMTKMECLSGGTTTSVEVEQLALLISIQDQIKVPVAEEDASPDKPVWHLFRELAYLALHLLSHGEATELN